MGCFSGRLMSTASDQKLFCKLCSPFNCSFDKFIGEKVVSPSYSSAILTPPPLGILSNEEECSKSELSRDTYPWWSEDVLNEAECSKK